MRRVAESALEKRQAIAYSKSSDIKVLETAIIKLSLDEIKCAITMYDATKAREEIFNKKKSLIKQLEKALISNGFNKDYLSLKYNCTDCNDTGYLSANKKCHCYNRMVLSERTKDSGLNPVHGSFNTFNQDIFSDEIVGDNKSQRRFMMRLKEVCEKYATDFPKVGNLILIGQASGTGKTFLVESILDKLLKRGFVGKYYSSTQLFNLFFKHRMGENIDLDILMDLPLLVIDDLGTEVMTKNVTIEYFYNLISERGIRGHHTVMSTNLPIEDITARYGDRITSRLFARGSQSYQIPNYCKDIRINQ